MSKPDFHLCDVCGGKVAYKHVIPVLLDKRPVWPDGRPVMTLDFCHECSLRIIGRFLRDPSMTDSVVNKIQELVEEATYVG